MSKVEKQIDKLRRSELHYAVIDNNTQKVRELLEKGADVNQKDRNGFSPLHFAAQNYSFELVKILVEFGSDINAKNIFGNTPIAEAVFNCRNSPGELIIYLKDNGADPTIKNKYEQSAVDTARIIANYDVKKYFKEYE